MYLWTFQNLDNWGILQNTGYLRPSITDVDEDLQVYYRWMISEMARRICQPNFSESSPVWAWYQWAGIKRRKPDLRYWRHYFQGTEGVRIGFEVREDTILLADFDLYENFVLHDLYLPTSDEDWQKFEELASKYGLSPINAHQNFMLRRKIEKSWCRIFDFGWSVKGEQLSIGPRHTRSIIAVLWELSMESIFEVTYYSYRKNGDR